MSLDYLIDKLESSGISVVTSEEVTFLRDSEVCTALRLFLVYQDSPFYFGQELHTYDGDYLESLARDIIYQIKSIDKS